jgi:hypothetical protein
MIVVFSEIADKQNKQRKGRVDGANRSTADGNAVEEGRALAPETAGTNYYVFMTALMQPQIIASKNLGFKRLCRAIAPCPDEHSVESRMLGLTAIDQINRIATRGSRLCFVSLGLTLWTYEFLMECSRFFERDFSSIWVAVS